ncbi:MAG: hypothetical protein MRY83_24150 [Flavobacteriales bacterium]|nr:hypothetical protein [Flavobacteriales bacterium]
MNVIFNSIEKDIVLYILDKFKIDKAYYCSGRKTKFEESELNGVDLHYISYWDTLHATYQNYDMNDFIPLDQKTLDFYASVEVEALYMDERNPPQTGVGWIENKKLPFDEQLYTTVPNKYVYKFSSKTYMERRRVYLRHLRFWNHIYTNTKIDVFIGHAIPHDTSQFIAWKMAEKLGIPYLMISDLSVPDYNIIINSDYRRLGNVVPKKLEELKSKYKSAEEISLSEDFQREWERVCVAKGENFKPWYFKKFEDEKKVSSTLKNRSVSKFKRVLNLIKTNRKKFVDLEYWYYRYRLYKGYTRGKRAFYNQNAVKPDFSKKFFYLAFHYQPELTSCPKGGVYAHQLLMVEMIAHYLPKDYVLYVKEHPAQTDAVRDFYFFKDILDYDNVRFVSLDTPSEKLLENCVATVTVAGTVCWEGMAKKKPGLIFGYHPNLFGPGVFPIVTHEDCKNAIEQIVKGVEITDFDLRLFFKALEETSENCHFQMPITKLTDEENAQTISKAYYRELSKMFPSEVKESQQKPEFT